MIRAIAIFFGLFFVLVALLFWAKTGPASADPWSVLAFPDQVMHSSDLRH